MPTLWMSSKPENAPIQLSTMWRPNDPNALKAALASEHMSVLANTVLAQEMYPQ